MWTGPDKFFRKKNYGDHTDPDQQDRLTESVWLTRQDKKGIYNAFLESEWDGQSYVISSPEGTRWAFGDLEDYHNLDYVNWLYLLDSIPTTEIVDRPLVVHLIDDDIYFQLTFKSWTDGGGLGGGGFSYVRSTPEGTACLLYTSPSPRD